jgi:hypothetical protein
VLLMQLDVFDLASWFVCDRVRGDCWLHLVDGRWISCLVRKTDRDQEAMDHDILTTRTQLRRYSSMHLHCHCQVD